MSQVNQLYRLQQIDDEIRDKRKRLSEVRRLQKESDELLLARRQASAAATKLQKWRSRQQDLNLELRALNDKTRRSEKRLYSGVVKNPKELEDLQREIESLGRRREALEDDVLEAMIMFEEAQEEQAAASELIGHVQAEWEQEQGALEREEAGLTQRLSELDSLRQQQIPSIPPTMMARYESIGRRRGGVAVVALRNGICRGCQVSVPANLVKAADEGQLVVCDSCDRILCPV